MRRTHIDHYLRPQVALLTLCISLVCLVQGFAAENEIPFTQLQGFILVEGTLEGIPGEFILDTGTDGLIVNQPSVKGKTQKFATIDRSVKLFRTDVGSFSMARQAWFDFDAYALDLAFLEEHLNRPIKGIVGISFVLPERVLIDYEKGIIRINEDMDSSLAGDDLSLIASIPISWQRNQVPTLVCEIDGISCRLGIDSGAGHNILFGSKAKKVIRKLGKDGFEQVRLKMPQGKDLQLVTFEPASLQMDNVNVVKSSFLLHGKTQTNKMLDGLVNLYLLGFDQFVIDTKAQRLLLYTVNKEGVKRS